MHTSKPSRPRSLQMRIPKFQEDDWIWPHESYDIDGATTSPSGVDIVGVSDETDRCCKDCLDDDISTAILKSDPPALLQAKTSQ